MTAHELVTHVGATLLDFVWQGALIGFETACALIALRRARPETRYAVACTGLLLCLLWPAAELALRLNGAAPGGSAATLVQMLPGGGGAAETWQGWLAAHLSWLVGAWAACSGALGLRLALGLVWIDRAARTQRTDAQLAARVSHLAAQFGITRAVRLRVVDALASPATAGWWRPVVLVPASLVSGMPPQLLEALLAHELAHIRRCDYLVNLVQSVIETILFYHPAVWWISHRVRVEREQIADDIAARQLGEPRRLALALSELERLQFSTHQLAQAANGGDLMSRIKRLVRPDTQATNWKAAVPAIALAVASLVGCAQTAVAGQAPAERAAPADKVRALANFSSCKKPEYPQEALRNKRVGTVTLGFLVGNDGAVRESTVRKSSGDASLDEAARLAIAKCTFSPARENGKPVEEWAQVQYVWSLQ
jgi:bla regulator protein BlaR1